MTSAVTNIVIAGLGGQGVITSSDIVAQAAFLAGHDVKKAEVHGMSQRGGSVTSDVRFGPAVLSPMVPVGEADYLVLLEATQIEPTRHYLRDGGIILSAASLDPAALPNAKALNVAMVGMLSACLEIPVPLWQAAICANLPEKLHELNLKVFDIGRSIAGKEKRHV